MTSSSGSNRRVRCGAVDKALHCVSSTSTRAAPLSIRSTTQASEGIKRESIVLPSLKTHAVFAPPCSPGTRILSELQLTALDFHQLFWASVAGHTNHPYRHSFLERDGQGVRDRGGVSFLKPQRHLQARGSLTSPRLMCLGSAFVQAASVVSPTFGWRPFRKD